MIFAETAPRYYAAGLPVIPLVTGQKRPLHNAWTKYGTQMPTAEEQAAWIGESPGSNIGLPLGKQSGLIIVDIDTEDPLIEAAIMQALAPYPSPWHRVGKKGRALAYRLPVGGAVVKSFQLKDAKTDRPAVEILSQGRQVVLPPSIHPETKAPYVANCELVDVLGALVPIPANIEQILRDCLMAHGVVLTSAGGGVGGPGLTGFVAAGNRDNQMTKMAGLFASAVTRGERTVLEAIGMMMAWGENCVEQVAGDGVDIKKGVSSLCGFLLRDVKIGKKVLPKGWDVGLDDGAKKELGLDFSHDHEEWAFDEIMTHLREQQEKHGATSGEWLDAIDYVLERLARSRSIDTVRADIILRHIVDISGNRMTVAALRSRLKDMKQGDIQGTDHAEIASKVIAEIEQFGLLRYSLGRFWQWAGSHWTERSDDEILKTISDGFGNLMAAKKRGDHVGIMKTMMSTLGTSDLRVEGAVEGINFANGYVTRDLRLLPHSPEYGCTYTLPYRYMPELAGEARVWHGFLDRCWGGDDDIREKKLALQQAICGTMFGLGTHLQRVILLLGVAYTGKSQLLDLVDSLLPDSVKTASAPDKWNDKFGSAQLAGKLLNIAGELSGKKIIDGQVFKSIVDGTPMQGQFKNQQIFKFRPIATHWFGSNSIPRTDDTTGGFNRRWLVLRFDRPVPAEERVWKFAEKLMVEREAIVAWALQGIKTLEGQSDFTLPASHHKWLEEIATANNSVRHFMMESGIVRPVEGAAMGGDKGAGAAGLSEVKLHEAYANFCRHFGVASPARMKEFRMQMIDLSCEFKFHVTSKNHGKGMNETIYVGLEMVEGPKSRS